MINWHYMNSRDYDILNNDIKTQDKIFFINNTNKLLCGDTVITDTIIVYNTDIPVTNLPGVLYINAYSLEGKIFDGVKWVNIINPIISDTTNKYTNISEIDTIQYSDNALIVTFIDHTTDIIGLNDFILDIEYNKNTKKYKINYAFAKLVNHNEKIHLDKLIDNIEYNDKKISIIFKNKNYIDIEICDYIDDGKNEHINISITGNEFVAECILGYDNDNDIISRNSNLFVIRKSNIIYANYIVQDTISNIISVLQKEYS